MNATDRTKPAATSIYRPNTDEAETARPRAEPDEVYQNSAGATVALFGQAPGVPYGEWIDPIPSVYASGQDVEVAEMRLALDEAGRLARRILAAVEWAQSRNEPMLCDGCGSTDKPVEATDDGRALACPSCLPVANAAINEDREVSR